MNEIKKNSDAMEGSQRRARKRLKVDEEDGKTQHEGKGAYSIVYALFHICYCSFPKLHPVCPCQFHLLRAVSQFLMNKSQVASCFPIPIPCLCTLGHLLRNLFLRCILCYRANLMLISCFTCFIDLFPSCILFPRANSIFLR